MLTIHAHQQHENANPPRAAYRAAVSTERSWMLEKAPTLMWFRSPRSTQPYQTDVCGAGKEERRAAGSWAYACNAAVHGNELHHTAWAACQPHCPRHGLAMLSSAASSHLLPHHPLQRSNKPRTAMQPCPRGKSPAWAAWAAGKHRMHQGTLAAAHPVIQVHIAHNHGVGCHIGVGRHGGHPQPQVDQLPLPATRAGKQA